MSIYCGRDFAPDDIQTIHNLMEQDPTFKRSAVKTLSPLNRYSDSLNHHQEQRREHDAFHFGAYISAYMSTKESPGNEKSPDDFS